MAAQGQTGMLRPQIIVLKEGVDTSQGKGQLLSNINACLTVADMVRTTLGPRGMDKLIVDCQGKATISNDGATILRLLEVVHPAARALVDISRAQDAEVGDGTTSVTLLAAELLKQAKPFVEEGLAAQVIIRAYRQAAQVASRRLADLSVPIPHDRPAELRELLLRVASTALSSKLVSAHRDFFSRMVVDAVQHLDAGLDERLIGIKRITGGSLEDSQLVHGVAFKKTFSYAGFEQQPKSFDNPAILCLNFELELKAERENAEVRVETVADYQSIVEAEWKLIYQRLETIAATGAQVVLSKLPIGDLATQYFADRGIFCAGRVPNEDLERVVQAVGGQVQTSLADIKPEMLGRCARFEERQVGAERFNLFSGCPLAHTCTLLLRGGSEQFTAEVERSLHDAIMVVRRTLRHRSIVAGGGAVEMELCKAVREYARTIPGKAQLLVAAYAQAFEALPRQLCENGGLDANEMLTGLRKAHAQGDCWMGINFATDSLANMMDAFVWEPALVKGNMINAATEAACMILSVDLTVKPSKTHEGMKHALPGQHP